MKEFTRNLLAGLSVLLPVMLSVQFLIWLAITIEQWLRAVLLLVLPESLYFPGLATAGFILLAAMIGYSTRLNLVNRFWAIPGKLIERLPLISYLYSTIQDFLEIMQGKSFEDRAVVSIDIPGSEGKIFGILTRKAGDSKSGLSGMMEKNEVAVYLPMSYQAGGYMLVVPEERVTRMDISPGDALRVILSAGVGQKN